MCVCIFPNSSYNEIAKETVDSLILVWSIHSFPVLNISSRLAPGWRRRILYLSVVNDWVHRKDLWTNTNWNLFRANIIHRETRNQYHDTNKEIKYYTCVVQLCALKTLPQKQTGEQFLAELYWSTALSDVPKSSAKAYCQLCSFGRNWKLCLQVDLLLPCIGLILVHLFW